jgi:hypothetical protein
MNKDLKNGLLVVGGAILLYLLYKKFSKDNDVVVTEEPKPKPIEVELSEEKPIESVLINV